MVLSSRRRIYRREYTISVYDYEGQFWGQGIKQFKGLRDLRMVLDEVVSEIVGWIPDRQVRAHILEEGTKRNCTVDVRLPVPLRDTISEDLLQSFVNTVPGDSKPC